VIEKKKSGTWNRPTIVAIYTVEDNKQTWQCQKSQRKEQRKRCTDTCVHHRKVKMPHCLTVTYSFLKSETKATRWRRHMKKEHSAWHLNFMRRLAAGSMLWCWKSHWAFNRRVLLSVTPTSQQVTVHYMAYTNTPSDHDKTIVTCTCKGAITSQFWNF
jgi:hypothetical protein